MDDHETFSSRPRHTRLRAIVSRALAAAALTAVGMGGAGCGAASRRLYRPPTVALHNVQVDGLGMTGAALRVALLVRNPNPYSLRTAGMRYRLLVGDSVTIATGVDSTHQQVAGRDSAVVVLPVQVSWPGLSAAGRAIASTGLVPYQIVGEITLDTPLGNHSVAVNQRGRFAPLR